MLCVLVLIKRSKLNERTVGRYVLPFIEAHYHSVNAEEKVVIRLLQSLGDGVKLAFV